MLQRDTGEGNSKYKNKAIPNDNYKTDSKTVAPNQPNNNHNHKINERLPTAASQASQGVKHKKINTITTTTNPRKSIP